jgi:AcrR family transcriptional regulator
MANAEAQYGSIRSAAAASRVRPTRRPEQRKASVQSMLDYARRQFVAKGYAATSVEEIAAGAGLSKGSVYFYFKSKENVLLALIEEAEQLIVEPSVAAVENSGPSARDQLVAFFHAQAVAGQQYSEWMMLIIIMSVEFHGRGSRAEDRLASLSDKMKTLLTTIVAEGKQQGIFTLRAPTRELASVIYAVTEGCFLEWYRYSEGLNGESLVRALRTAVLDGVLVRPDS